MIAGDFGVWTRFAPMTAGLAVGLWWWRRNRVRFSWSDHLMFVVFLSVITTSFTWTFDWVVLLPAAVLILVRFYSRPRIHAWPFAGLVGIEVLMVVQSVFAGNYFFSIWAPPALAFVCWTSSTLDRIAIPLVPVDENS
jgi:hypothetical protein